LQHTRITVDPNNLIDAETIVGVGNKVPLLYEGSSLLVDPDNPLVLEILTASSTAYSYEPDKAITEVQLRMKLMVVVLITADLGDDVDVIDIQLCDILVSSYRWKKYGIDCWTSSTKQCSRCFLRIFGLLL
jgi:hypothetical protein